MIENVMSYVPQVIILIGVLAFLISVFTEVTKNIPILKRIPTDLQVFILAIVVCVVGLYAYGSAVHMVIYWWYVVAAVILAILVAFVAMYGWEKFGELAKRYIKKDDTTKTK